jgi:hypothetical protein
MVGKPSYRRSAPEAFTDLGSLLARQARRVSRKEAPQMGRRHLAYTLTTSVPHSAAEIFTPGRTAP